MAKARELIGLKHGLLSLLSRSENVGTKTAWNCRCDCGKVFIARTDNILSGKTKTCGHTKDEWIPTGAIALEVEVDIPELRYMVETYVGQVMTSKLTGRNVYGFAAAIDPRMNVVVVLSPPMLRHTPKGCDVDAQFSRILHGLYKAGHIEGKGVRRGYARWAAECGVGTKVKLASTDDAVIRTAYQSLVFDAETDVLPTHQFT